jgi:two-component SAPR family response regulator
MIFYAADDEPLQLRLLERSIHEADPTAELHSFACGEDLLQALKEGSAMPDAAFLDIELPDIGGLELAYQIKQRTPNTNIIFVTGFSQYAQEAYAVRPSGYVMKPVSREKILQELQNLRHPIEVKASDKLRVQCFGNFEVFDHERPVKFKRGKTKELFAYLIDRRGAACSTGEILAVLWEDDANSRKNSYVSNLSADLIQTFQELGHEDVVVKHRGVLSVVTDRVCCDYYDWNKGMSYAVNAYRGEYMSQFEWADMTLGGIEQSMGYYKDPSWKD